MEIRFLAKFDCFMATRILREQIQICQKKSFLGAGGTSCLRKSDIIVQKFFSMLLEYTNNEKFVHMSLCSEFVFLFKLEVDSVLRALKRKVQDISDQYLPPHHIKT